MNGIRPTEPLLLALNGLFQQVSERNRQLQELTLTLEAKIEERTRDLSQANHLLEQIALTDRAIAPKLIARHFSGRSPYKQDPIPRGGACF